MNRVFKVCVLIVSVLSVIVLIMMLLNFRDTLAKSLKISLLESDLINLQNQNTSLKVQLKELTTRLEEEIQANASLKTGLDNVTKEKGELTLLLSQANERLNTIQQEKTRLESELKSVQVRLSEEKELFSKLSEDNKSLIKSLESRFKELTQAIETRLPTASSMNNLSESISRDEVLRPKGKVLSVDKKNDFVVIDLGEDNGVKIGDLFQVHNGGSFKGKVEVSKVSKTRSIGYIIEKPPNVEIIEGDEVE